MMNREDNFNQLTSTPLWDIIIIGGGATGLGTAVEAASRGYKTLLLEQHDFAKGTSSRSTKLVHGGVRYLQQGDISLVLEALHERGLLRRNATHLVSNQSFIIPNYDWWEGPFYRVGLKVYDMLAGKLGLSPSKRLSKEEVLQHIPTLKQEGLRGGVIYYDGQFDDARLAISLAQTAENQGATLLNYTQVTGLLKKDGLVCGVQLQDIETQTQYQAQAKVVINATGVFADKVLQMDDPEAEDIIQPSQGVHIVLDKRFLPGNSAIMVPRTADGRVLFAVPWHNKAVVGTTDTPVDQASAEPRALEEEVDFILEHAAQYLSQVPTRKDVMSVFAGLRPLVRPSSGNKKNTASLSRSHTLMVSLSGLVTITGGKWTTYRKMGEDTIDKAVLVGGLPESSSQTKNLRIHGWANEEPSGMFQVYGTEASKLHQLASTQPALGQRLHENLPYIGAQVVWAVRHEQARTVEDVLARRTRALFLDARASIAMAPQVASLMAQELGHSAQWQQQQVEAYTALANGYLPSSYAE